MRRLDELSGDFALAQRTAGIAVPDGSGRIVRNGVVVSAGDVMRSEADRLRNRALEMQTAAYRAPMEMMNRELARVPGMQQVQQMQQPGFTAAAATAQPRAMRTLSGQPMPEAAADPNELQRSLAILRDERTRIGSGVKDYSERRLADIARLPGGAQQIINEANAVVPILRQSRVEDQTANYVTGLDTQARNLNAQITEVEKQITPEPEITREEVESQVAYLRSLPTYADTPPEALVTLAQDFLGENKRRQWEASNRNTLAVREGLRRQLADVHLAGNDFAKRGVFARPAAQAPTAGAAGSSTAALAGLASDSPSPGSRELSQMRIAAGDATLPGSGTMTEGRNPGGAANVTSGLSWLPPGAIAYGTRDGGFVVNGVAYPSEAAARAAIDAQRAQIDAEASADPAALTAMLTGDDAVSPRTAQIETLADAMTARDERRAIIDRWFNAPPSAEREAALRSLLSTPDPTLRVADLLAL